MKNWLKRSLAFVAALVLLASLCTISAGAADAWVEDEPWNILLVIDGSASLIEKGTGSDPDGLRFEAISSLLDILDDGCNVGAIMFRAYLGSDTSDEAMRKGIVVDTGMRLLESDSSRTNILNELETAKMSYQNTPQTDIGTALYVGALELAEAQASNGYHSAMFLFTDGVMDVNTAIADKAEENKNSAIQIMQENGIEFCGVFLNKDGRLHTDELERIACNATGIPFGQNLGDHYITITDASDLMDCTDAFLRLLGNCVGTPVTGDLSFRIPGVGVEDVSIRIATAKGGKLPTGMSVIITKPDGSTLLPNEDGVRCNQRRTYVVYKIQNPAAGLWNVHVELPEEAKDTIIIETPVYNLNIGAQLVTEPAEDQLHANMTAKLSAYLVSKGQTLTNAEAYQEYNCRLIVTDYQTGKEVDRFEIAQNSNSMFEMDYALDYGKYEISAEFYCGDLTVSTQKIPFLFTNTEPYFESTLPPIKINTGLFKTGKESQDISKYANDLEDGKNLTFSVVGGTCDMLGVSMLGSEITVNGKTSGDGTIVVQITDTQGASAQADVQVQVKNTTVRTILLMLAVLIAAFFIAVLVIRIFVGQPLQGDTTVEINIAGLEDENGDRHQIHCSALLDNPGSGHVKAGTTLYELLHWNLRQEESEILSSSRGDEALQEAIKNFIEIGHKAELQKVKVSKTKQQGKGAVRVNDGNEGGSTETLYDSDYTLDLYEGVGNASFTLRYTPPAEELEEEEQWETNTGLENDEPQKKSRGFRRKKPQDTDNENDSF